MGIPYAGYLNAPFLWPILGMNSQAFYLTETDPMALRYLTYFAVTVILAQDFHKLRLWQRLLGSKTGRAADHETN